MPDIIDRVWSFVVGEEGETLDLTHDDKGNWTGGEVGVGELRGSKFGVSAKTYPTVDIAALTRDGAKAIFVRDYWQKFSCDQMPAPLGLLVVDAAYNGGHPIQWLQLALGVANDGVFGPATKAAIAAQVPAGRAKEIATEMLAQRLAYLSTGPLWSMFGAADGKPKGWARRLMALPFEAMNLLATS